MHWFLIKKTYKLAIKERKYERFCFADELQNIEKESVLIKERHNIKYIRFIKPDIFGVFCRMRLKLKKLNRTTQP